MIKNLERNGRRLNRVSKIVRKRLEIIILDHWDSERIVKYKDEIVLEYNRVVNYISENIDAFTRKSQQKLLDKIDACERTLEKQLKTLDFQINFPSDKLDLVNNTHISEISEQIENQIEEASGVTETSLEFDTDDIDDIVDIGNESDKLVGSATVVESGKTVNLNEKSEKNIENIIMAPPTEESFLDMCSKHLPKQFAGDPLGKSAFIKSIKFLKKLGKSEENSKLLASYVQMRLIGKACEYVSDDCEDIDVIVKAIEDNCKAENSKVVAGKLMALRADRTNLTEFTKKAEQLCEAFQRSLILEGTSRDKANEFTIEKAVDLCKVNTTSTVVQSMLHSTKFEDASEVIAKYTIVSRDVSSNNQVLQFRSHNRVRGNYRNNFHQQRYSNNNNYGGNYNRNNSNNRNFNRNYNNDNRGRNFGNSRGQSRGNYRHNDRRINQFSVNDEAPPSGARCKSIERAENSN